MKSHWIVSCAFIGFTSLSMAEAPPLPAQHAGGAAAAPGTATRGEAGGKYTPVPGERKEGYAMVGNTSLSNIVFETASANALIRVAQPNGKDSRILTGYFDSNGVPCTYSVSPTGQNICRPLDPANAIERKTIEELAKYIASRPEKDKSPFKEFTAWYQSGFPPNTSQPPALKLGATPEELAAFKAYNEGIAEYRKKIADKHAQQSKELTAELLAAKDIEDPKTRENEYRSILAKLFTQGMEAPGVEAGTDWEQIVGKETGEKFRKVAAAHYSGVQVEGRKKLMTEIAENIRKDSPQIAAAIDRVKNGAATKAFDLLLSDSFKEASPQCATCGGMPHQAEFDTLIDEGIAAALKTPAASVAAAGAPAAAAAVGDTPMAAPNQRFRLGTCYFCKSAAPAYAQRVQEIRAWLHSHYGPNIQIEEYDAASAGEIAKGEIKITDGIKDIFRAPIRGEIATFTAGVLQRLRPFKK